MKRYGQIVSVKPERLEDYKRLHTDVWPHVKMIIEQCNIRNYSIYYMDNFLFSYYEYVGDDYEADMAKMGNDPVTLEWWAVCKPCLTPLVTCKESECWTEMKEIFHQD